MVVALLDAGADINFATPTGNSDYLDFNFTPLMHAVDANNAGLAKLLLKRGADGTKHTTHWQAALLGVDGFDVGSTALDIARLQADHNAESTETLEALRRGAAARAA